MSAAMIDDNVTSSLKADYRGKRHYVQSHRKTSLFGSENEQQNEESGVCKNGNNYNSNSLAIGYPRSPIETFSPQRDEEVKSSKSVARNGTSHKDQPVGIIEEKEMNGLIKAAKERAERRELDRQIRSSGEEDILAHAEKTPEPQTQKRTALQTPWYTDPDDSIGNSQVRGTTLTKRSSSTPQPTFPRSTSEVDYHTYTAQQLKNLRMPTRKYGNNDSAQWNPENRGTRLSKSRDEETYQTSSSKIGESFMRIFNLDNQNLKNGNELSEPENPGTPNGKLSTLRNTPYAQHY